MTIKTLAITALFSASLLAGMTAAPTLAFAADSDLYCFEYTLNGHDELECDTIGNYKAECKLVDPNTKSKHCKDINSQLRATINKFNSGS